MIRRITLSVTLVNKEAFFAWSEILKRFILPIQQVEILYFNVFQENVIWSFFILTFFLDDAGELEDIESDKNDEDHNDKEAATKTATVEATTTSST